MLYHAFHPPDQPSLTHEQRTERLRAELAATQQALCVLQGALTDAKTRLGMISRIARDVERTRRAPGASWAAVRAALYSRPEGLKDVGPDLPIL
ncbi:hypothetical protein [Plantactinospora soyae]|uniref:Uncharacterized protein n=1 Tax=Plantactinospora soyae TaxID=1544732 RepID=A0A927M6R6_9ACTN|nr:hypothetical protein [Plantactinospora soyae]MBE1489037.1 hypothetical protein [Plantactinospora soyae]